MTRERIEKCLSFTVEKADELDGTFEGYAAAWSLDAQGDIIERGAFAKTVREGMDRVRIYWQHDLEEPVGLPLVMAETPLGLFVKGRISDTARGRDALTLMRDGVVTEMSIGAQIVKARTGDDGHRHLTELRLFDISLVSLAANPEAVITAVKEDAALPATQRDDAEPDTGAVEVDTLTAKENPVMENEVLSAFNEIKAATGSLSEAVAQLRESKERQLEDLPTAEKLMEQMAPELKALIDEAIEAKAARPDVDDQVKTTHNLGDLFKAVYDNAIKDTPIPDWLTKADQSTTAAYGGVLAPDEFRAQLLEIPMEQAVVRPRAQVIPMGSDTLNVPAWDQETHASTYYGGVLAAWTGENSPISETAAKFLNVQLGVNELAALNFVSDKLMKASPMAVGTYLARAFGNALRFQEDEAFFTGDASSKPRGFIGSACELTQTRATGGDVKVADIVGMYSKQLGTNAVWVANKTVIPKLFALADASTANIWMPSAVPNLPGTLLGCPVIFTEHCAALGSKADIALCDFGYYLIGDLGTLAIDYSEHYRFANVQGAMRLVEYVDGKPWMASSYTPHKGAALSPFVVLAA